MIYMIIAGYFEDDTSDEITNDPVFKAVLNKDTLITTDHFKITTCKPYLGEAYPFLGILSQLWRHGLSLKIYSTVLNLNIAP